MVDNLDYPRPRKTLRLRHRWWVRSAYPRLFHDTCDETATHRNPLTGARVAAEAAARASALTRVPLR